ncbi:META domain-containing protein [Paracoccus spongiarum]|uniref:META domain-containing protein n=1 Tax=Paracoccus spongiarum TaxID=3064387 RepID=A0ABT9J8C2_9RHOB|nr:META domain-containing protein [Paracoccus sp. 2205BS29-5]MDP5305884.1 META domain-containing protein [Paracoccus sp. 2205BS29-5]
MPAMNRARLSLVGLAALLALAACQPVPPAAVTPGGEDRGFIPGGSYVLVGMDGATVPLRDVTLLVEEKRLSGQGPCNSFSAANNADLPAVSLSPIISTKMACKDLKLENRFLSVLQAATAMEFYGGVLKVKSPSTWLIFEHGVRAGTGTVSALEQARGVQ